MMAKELGDIRLNCTSVKKVVQLFHFLKEAKEPVEPGE
jgi:hypothetical protein